MAVSIDTVIVVIGVFVITAFSIVIYIQKKHDMGVGFWPLIGAAGAFITLAEIFELMGNEEMHLFLVIVALIVFFIVALLKYWDTLRIIEKT